MGWVAHRRVNTDSVCACFFRFYVINLGFGLDLYGYSSGTDLRPVNTYSVILERFFVPDISSSVIVMGTPLFSYTPDLIRALRGNARCICRATRKLLFLYRLWCPAYARWSAPVQSTESDSQPATVPSSQPSPRLRFATWNVHSLRNKHLVVSDTITSCGIDLLVATESWHQSSSDVTVRRSTPSGYSAVDRLWPDGSSYGGIAYSTDPTSPFVGYRLPPRRPHSRPSLCPSLHHVVLSRSWRLTTLDQHLHRHRFSMSFRYYSSSSHSTTRNSSSLVTSMSTWRIQVYRLHLNFTP